MTAENQPVRPDFEPDEIRSGFEQHEAVESVGHWQTKIILQRHGRYNGFPEHGWMNPTEEEKQYLGHLTEEGAAEARTIAQQRISEALTQAGTNVDFLVVASPTRWLGHPEFGQRALETGEIIADEVTSELRAAGLPETQLLRYVRPSEEGSIRQSDKLVEAKMFDEHIDFTNELREKYGGQNREFWDAYNADADRDHRKAVGAEGSPETADRVNAQLSVLARWAKVRNIEQPHRKTVIFVVSHHEAIEPFAQRVLGVEPGKFEPGYNDGIEIKIDAEGIARTTVAGKVIEVAFAAHGSPPSVDHE